MQPSRFPTNAIKPPLAVLAAILLLIGCAQTGYRKESNIGYTPPGWPEALEADIYVPSGAGPHPAVLVVHGGSWAGRDRHDMDHVSERLAARGFVVMNASYRFAPEYRFPSQLYDLQQAVHWLRASAARYGVDPERVGAFGYSAGGHLVELLGTVSHGDALDKPYGGPDSRLQAVVAGGAPSDLRKFSGGKLVPQLIGATRDQRPDLFAAASPVTHVSADDPPMFLYHGGGDRTVDPSHSADMKRALDSVGVRAELRTVPLLGHVSTFLLARGTESAAIDFLAEVLGADR